jgi:hypothetical protein
MAQEVHEDIAVEIARELELSGTSVRRVRAYPQQRAVDVSWAAKRAGRMIGEHVRTSITPLSLREDGEVAVVAIVEQRRPAHDQ